MSFDLNKAEEYLSAYKNAGVVWTSQGKFLASLVESKSPPKGRGIQWLEDIFALGLPQSMNEEKVLRIEKIEKAAAMTQKPEDAEILRDFSRKISLGRQLSEKQESFLSKLMERAEREVKYVEINDDINAFIETLKCKVLYGTSSYYWQARESTYRRASQIFNYCEKTGKIDTDDYKYLRSIFKGFTEQWEEVDSWRGNIFYLKGTGEPVLVLEKYVVTRGMRPVEPQILVNVLVNGVSKSVSIDRLLKRKPKFKIEQ